MLPSTPVDNRLPDLVDAPSQNNPYARILAKMAKQHRLVAVHWELTYRCNETCAHCYLEASPPLGAIPGELTTVQAKQVVDQIAGIGALQMTFSGGEILVRRDFFEIAEYARRKRLAIRLMTNGILINPRLADCIAALHPTGVELSLYGADAATHDAITQRPRSFELTLRAFRLLRERGVHTVMKTPLMRENVRQLPALRALAANVGATFYYDPTITAKDNGDTSPVKHRLTYDDLVSLLRAEINADDFALAPLRDDTQNPCAIGSSSLVIDPYGAVFPCLQTRIPAGNLRDQSLKEIWDGALVFRELGALTWSELPICRTCELNRLCTRCHGMAREANGDLHAPSTIHCRDALARRQVLVEKKILPLDFPIPAHLQDYLFDVARHADFS